MHTFNNAPLKASQSERLVWNNLRKHPGSPASTLSWRFEFRSSITNDSLQKAIYRLLTGRCAGFTCRFVEIEAILFKHFHQPSLAPVIITDSPSSKRIFDIHSGNLYLFEWQPVQAGGNLQVHLSHLVMDGACFADFCAELAAVFDSSALSPLNHGRHSLPGKGLDYWKEQLSGRSLHQPLPFLPERVAAHDVTQVRHRMPHNLCQLLAAFCDRYQTTLFQVMTASFSILIRHYISSDQENEAGNELTVTYCLSQRLQDEPIGCYLGLLPLFVACEATDTLLTVLGSIQSQRQQHRQFQRISSEELLALVSPSHLQQPAFNLIVNHSPGLLPLETFLIHDEPVIVSSVQPQSGHNCLSLIYHWHEDTLEFQLESDRGLIVRPLLLQLATHFEKTLSFLMENPARPLTELDFRLPSYPHSVGRITDLSGMTLASCFSEAAEIFPDKIAIQSLTGSLSYAMLTSLVQQIRHWLRGIDSKLLEKGVGICLARECHLPAAMLACIHESVMFVPLALELPNANLQAIIEQTGLTVLIVDAVTVARFSELRLMQLDVSSLSDTCPEEQDDPGSSRLLQNSIAYTLFTSGSSGKPKGVKVSFHSLLNFLNSMRHQPGFTGNDTLLAMTPVSFDISIAELLLPLICSATVFIIDDQTRKNVSRLVTVIDSSTVTVIQATPSSFAMLKEADWRCSRQLRLWAGGEALTMDLANWLVARGHVLFNLYGPTEATIWASTAAIKSNQPVLIGTAVDNTQLVIQDQTGKTPPFGIPGELLIVGDCVAEGYTQLESSRFVTLPTGQKGYLTGDKVVAYGPDTIKYLKRLDEQLKLRGHRIEPMEINDTIRQLAPSMTVATIMRQHPEPHLGSYFTCPESEDIDAIQILQELRTLLPDYKVPSFLVRLETFPLTTSGKIDKKALETMSAPKQALKSPEPLRDRQDPVASLQQLIREHFGIHIDEPNRSLTDYGFDSLSFNRLSLLLEKVFSVSLPPHQFYRMGDLVAIGQYMADNRRNHRPADRPTAIARPSTTRIAIIGFDALLPGGFDANAFWNALVAQRDLVGTHQRSWLASGMKAGFIDNIEGFDRHFFKLSPLEVARMDPRQRLLLQCAWKTLEHAGYATDSLKGTPLSCFVAATGMDYQLSQCKSGLAPHPYSLSGNALAMLANRLSWHFDWQGPSMAVDTACSGSLTALIRACHHLTVSGKGTAFVAAVNLIIDDHLSEALEAGNFLSKRGHCASFSSQGDGYVRGEGVIGFLIKPLEQALEDGDTVHAVIESIAENHGGRAQSLTAPNEAAQSALLCEAYADPALAAALSYIETHGTGTPLGDPIEIDALKSFEMRALPETKQPVLLGSVKTHIGHLEAAAGFASLLKVILAMRHQKLPGNLHFMALNPLISLQDSRFSIVNQNMSWNPQGKRVAGISSFGFGGSNAHIVLSEPDRLPGDPDFPASEPCLIVLSAKSREALNKRIDHLREDIATLPPFVDLQDIAWTLAFGRDHFKEHRCAFISASREELKHQLTDFLSRSFNPIGSGGLAESRQKWLNNEMKDLGPLFTAARRQRVPLTPYCFDTQNYWYTNTMRTSGVSSQVCIQAIAEDTCEIILPATHPFLTDHRVFSQKILPGVAHLELAMWVCKKLNIRFPVQTIEDFYWLRPVVVDSSAITLQITLENMGEKQRILVRNQQGMLYSEGTLSPEPRQGLASSWIQEIKSILQSGQNHQYDSSDIYPRFSSLGIQYGPKFQGIDKVTVSGNVSRAELTIQSDESLVSLMDCALQSGMAISLESSKPGLMPFTLESLHINSAIDAKALTRVQVFTRKYSPFRTSIAICDESDRIVMSFVDLGIRAATLVYAAQAMPVCVHHIFS